MQTRIYTVSSNGVTGNQTRLVEAASAAQAIRHVTRGTWNAEVPNTKQLAELMKSGVSVEKAGDDANTSQTN